MSSLRKWGGIMASSLHNAKKAKNDEFYTQYADIEKEMNAYLEYNENVFRDKVIFLPCDDPEWSNFTKYFAQNFEKLGLKKLISTSYVTARNNFKNKQITLFDDDPLFNDEEKIDKFGKVFTLTRKDNVSEMVDINDLRWEFLGSNGDFRNEDIKKLRDEADIIITNPPFSLFREFVSWIVEANKDFVIIGNQNAITYKDIFSLIKAGKVWLGESIHSGDRIFNVPDDYPLEASGCGIDEKGYKYIKVKGVRWFTTLEHGRRHQPLQLMTKADNLKFNTKLIKKLKEFDSTSYPVYDNYNAIEVPFTMAIPSDFDGYMGVPITFLDKFNPEQFEIVGLCASAGYDPNIVGLPFQGEKDARGLINGKNVYARVFIKRKCEK